MSAADHEHREFLTRRMLCERLNEYGFPIAMRTLNKLCSPAINQGPPIARYWGMTGRHHRPLYRWEDALRWALDRSGKHPVTTYDENRRKSTEIECHQK